MGEGNTYSLQVGVPTVQPLWTSVWRSLREAKNKSTTWHRYTTFGLMPKDSISFHRDTCSSIFMLFFVFLCFHILAIKVWNPNEMWGTLPYFLNLDLTTWLAFPMGNEMSQGRAWNVLLCLGTFSDDSAITMRYSFPFASSWEWTHETRVPIFLRV